MLLTFEDLKVCQKDGIGQGLHTGWLEIAVRSPAGTGTFTILDPRQETTPTPYALYAEAAGGVSGGITGGGTADRIAKFTGTSTIGDSVIYEKAGNIGIGTTDPEAKLEVSGTADESIRASSPTLVGRWIELLYHASWGPTLRAGSGYERLTLDANSGGGAGKIVLGRNGDRVGIGGQLDPVYELDVSGDIRATGTIYGTATNADKVDGYDAGNSSGQVAVSNGTVCTSLNADTVDGYHASSFVQHVYSGVCWSGGTLQIPAPTYGGATIYLACGNGPADRGLGSCNMWVTDDTDTFGCVYSTSDGVSASHGWSEGKVTDPSTVLFTIGNGGLRTCGTKGKLEVYCTGVQRVDVRVHWNSTPYWRKRQPSS